jgi:hypothetical protein
MIYTTTILQVTDDSPNRSSDGIQSIIAVPWLGYEPGSMITDSKNSRIPSELIGKLRRYSIHFMEFSGWKQLVVVQLSLYSFKYQLISTEDFFQFT